MAHGEETRRRLRKSYIFDGLELPAAAAACGVPLPTARRWKREAIDAGDDWDKARGAQLLAGGSIEEVLRQAMAGLMRQVQATIQAVEDDGAMAPAVKVQMLASCADSCAKLTAAMRRMMPETDALAVRMETIKKLGEFISAGYPQHREAFLEILKPFADEVARG
ncbi:MAG: DUF1804 family protein [Methylococcaceae bacterium]|nr:MAG: DUF1804 family protein [Methylococcaceae bacterium]